ncbi:hypothetical protein N8A98_07070 [Devosia neptuniae]|uniref:Uncharacterized protein n=1 Tax=Devosia neptuniae TaxID=191302 RepID=A0ABY6CGJ9_9HYPH|nr:hypothetical protein [Devosia neptuniae]UXN70943.1 hypothetical protein N8A98_07070 [Devosia neptuniae]
MRTRAGLSPSRVGDLMRDFAATLAFIALLAAIFVGAFGVA